MRLFLQTFSLLATLICTTQAQALISFNAGLGFSSGTLKNGDSSTDYSGSALNASVHLDPIPLVPVSFGLGINLPGLSGKEDGHTVKLTGLGVDLQVMAWSPIGLMGFTPYCKMSYQVYGAYKYDGKISVEVAGASLEQDYSVLFDASGLNFSVGVMYSLIPLVDLFAELNMRNETLKPTEVKVAGQKVETSADGDLAATNFVVGVSVGL